MKKVLALFGCVVLALSLYACGGDDGGTGDEGSGEVEELVIDVDNATKTFDGSSYSDKGDGYLIVTVPGGDTGGGNIPTWTVTEGLLQTAVVYDIEQVNSAPETYIFFDGVEAFKGKINGPMHGGVMIEGGSLKPGTHVVEMVQFADDDPSGEVTMYKKGTFEIVE